MARTYFSCVSKLEAVTPNPLLEAAINGSGKSPSLFIGPNNIPTATKLQQIWMRTKQAQKKLEEAKKLLDEDFIMYSKQATSSENNIRAFYRSKYVTLKDVEDWDHEKIRDIVINENNEYKEEKRVLQYIPSGEVTNFLREKSEKGMLAARSEIAKEEFARSYRFIDVIHSNNTEKNLDYKLEELYNEKDKKEKLANSMKESVNKQAQKGLEEYDHGLGKMFEVMVYNISAALN